MASPFKQKGISGHGHGKWHSLKSLARYRRHRDARKRQARLDRRRNRR